MPTQTSNPSITERVDIDEFLSQDVVENDPYWQFGEWNTRVTADDEESRQQNIQSTLVAEESMSRRSAICDYFGLPDDQIEVSAMANDLTSAFVGVPQLIEKV